MDYWNLPPPAPVPIDGVSSFDVSTPLFLAIVWAVAIFAVGAFVQWRLAKRDEPPGTVIRLTPRGKPRQAA